MQLLRQLLSASSAYITESEREHVQSVKLTLFLVTLAILVLILQNTISGDGLVVYILLGGLLTQFIVYWMVERGSVHYGVMVLACFMVVMITLIAMRGQGSHDLTIMGFPVVLVIAALIQRRKGFMFTALLTLLCVGWLVYGMKEGFYVVEEQINYPFADLITVLVILLVTAFITKNIGERLSRSLEEAEDENKARLLKSAELDLNLKEKENLLNGVHQVAMNGMNYLSELLKDRRLSKGNQEIISNKMELRTLAVLSAHQQLFEHASLTWIDVPNYFTLFTERVEKSGILSHVDWILHVDKGYLHIDQIIHLGLMLAEILYLMESFEDETSILIAYDVVKEKRVLTVSSGRLTQKAIGLLKNNSIVDIMVRQIKGQLSIASQMAKVSISFSPNAAHT